MPEKSKGPRRSFSDEFKQAAVDLVVKQNYSFKAAADAVGVSSRSLREWHEKRAPEPVPCDEDNSDSFHVAAMCRAFQVSRSGYYRWLKAEPSLRTLRSQRIHASVRQAGL